jgi:hypothetical protein
MPAKRSTFVWSISFSTAGVVSVALYWSSSIVSAS